MERAGVSQSGPRGRLQVLIWKERLWGHRNHGSCKLLCAGHEKLKQWGKVKETGKDQSEPIQGGRRSRSPENSQILFVLKIALREEAVIHVCMQAHAYVCVCLYACMYVCICISPYSPDWPGTRQVDQASLELATQVLGLPLCTTT